MPSSRNHRGMYKEKSASADLVTSQAQSTVAAETCPRLRASPPPSRGPSDMQKNATTELISKPLLKRARPLMLGSDSDSEPSGKVHLRRQYVRTAAPHATEPHGRGEPWIPERCQFKTNCQFHSTRADCRAQMHFFTGQRCSNATRRRPIRGSARPPSRRRENSSGESIDPPRNPWEDSTKLSGMIGYEEALQPAKAEY